ncbi:Eukaryotic translation initiation factor 4G [Operophtera brumata]|uniref:Eukaryotic translation initiation factor 4G n=1 Tax=Operophtera brumata TaxID=104452 RepID=A0A0L7LBJ4_OPEBR|nr:Eukaryotic translation initiation factor 4G [Operophtera brumata]
MHTLSSFEEKYELKWVEPFTEARNETTAPVQEPMPLTQVSSPAPVNDFLAPVQEPMPLPRTHISSPAPVNDSLFEPAIPVACIAREDVDSDIEQKIFKKENLTELFLNKAKNDMHMHNTVEETSEFKLVEPVSCDGTTASVHKPMPLPGVSSPAPVNDSVHEPAIPVSSSPREEVRLEEVDSDMEPTTIKKENLTELFLNKAKNDMHRLSSVEETPEPKLVDAVSCNVTTASVQEPMPLPGVSSPASVNDFVHEPAIPVSSSPREEVKLEELDSEYSDMEPTTIKKENLTELFLKKAKNDMHTLSSVEETPEPKLVEPVSCNVTTASVQEPMPLPGIPSPAPVNDSVHEPAIPVFSSPREEVKLKEVDSDMEPMTIKKENLTELFLNKAKNDMHTLSSVEETPEPKLVEPVSCNVTTASVQEPMPLPGIPSPAPVNDSVHEPAIPVFSSPREEVKLKEVDSDMEPMTIKKENLTELFLNKAKNDMHTLSSVEETSEHKLVELVSCNVTTAPVQEPMPLPGVSSPAPVNDSVHEPAIPVSSSPREEVKLEEVDPDVEPMTFKKENLTEDEIKTIEFCEKLKDILDKLTTQKLDILLDELKTLEINNEKRLEMIVDVLFEKAIRGTDFSKACAAMSQKLSVIKVPSDHNPEQFVSFIGLVIQKCQNQFESWKTDEQEKIEKELAETNDSVKKEELRVILDEETNIIRLRAFANVRFMGELYKLKMMTSKIIIYCIKNLLECLRQLLTTTGKELENEYHVVIQLDVIFKEMQLIVDCEDSNISSRIKSMVQDVIDLRKYRWVNMSVVNSQLKSMDQIQKESEQRARLIDKMNVYGMEGSRGGGNKSQISVMDNTFPQTTKYSVDTLKHEAVTQETLNYIKLPPICFKIFGKNMNSVLEKFQADPTSRRHINQIQKEADERAFLIEKIKVHGIDVCSGRGGGNQSQISDMDNTFPQTIKYSVDTLKLEAATPETMNYVKLPPKDFEKVAKNKNSVLEKFQADSTSCRDMYTVLRDTTTTYHLNSASTERPTFNSRGECVTLKTSLASWGLINHHRMKSNLREGETPSRWKYDLDRWKRITNNQEFVLCEFDERLNGDSMKRFIKSSVEQSLINSDDTELAADIKQVYPPQYHAAVVGEIMKLVLYKTDDNEIGMITKSLYRLVATNTISTKNFLAGLQETFEYAPDLFIDVPMLYNHLGKILAPHIEKHITLRKIFDLCDNIITANQGELLLKEIIHNLYDSMGPIFVKSVWQESGLRLSQWICEEQVLEWIAENKFEILVGDDQACDGGTDDIALVASQEPLPDEKMKKAVGSVFDLSLNELDNAKLVAEVKQLFPPQYHAAFIGEFLNMTLEKTVKEVNVITMPLYHLVATNTISTKNFLAGLQETFEYAPDLFIDVPMLYNHLGKILAPHIEKHITLRKIFDLCENIITANQGELLLKEIIHNLYDSMGPIFVKSIWQESGLQLSQWICEEQVPEWIAENKFEILVGDDQACDGGTNDMALVAPQEPLPDDKMKKAVGSMIDLSLNELDNAKLVAEVKKRFPPQYHAALVGEFLNMTLEKTAKEVNVITKSLFHLVATNTIGTDNFEAGLQETLEFAPDLLNNTPMIYDHLGKILSPHIEKHITLAKIFELCESIILMSQGDLLLKAIIHNLNESMGPTFVKSKWQASGLQLSQWMSEELVPKWIVDNNFEYLELLACSWGSDEPLNGDNRRPGASHEKLTDRMKKTIKSTIDLSLLNPGDKEVVAKVKRIYPPEHLFLL